jgi:hypothetical protein
MYNKYADQINIRSHSICEENWSDLNVQKTKEMWARGTNDRKKPSCVFSIVRAARASQYALNAPKIMARV